MKYLQNTLSHCGKIWSKRVTTNLKKKNTIIDAKFILIILSLLNNYTQIIKTMIMIFQFLFNVVQNGSNGPNNGHN